jgi:hypothetical protein
MPAIRARSASHALVRRERMPELQRRGGLADAALTLASATAWRR